MSFIRSCISRSVFLLGAGVAVAAQAEVRIDGPIEYGVFESRYQDFQPGERVLTRSEQNIQQTTEVPAKLGTKFGMRYQLSGKQEGDTPLTLLYLTRAWSLRMVSGMTSSKWCRSWCRARRPMSWPTNSPSRTKW